jgi:beta-alanine degradation protein BauB
MDATQMFVYNRSILKEEDRHMPQPQPQRDAGDPTVVDAERYNVVTEDDDVRILRTRYAPRAKSVMHSHPKHIAIALSAGKFRFTFPDGTSQEMDIKVGDALIAPAGPHLPELLSNEPFDAIIVELKS